jgi:hypothetical protein
MEDTSPYISSTSYYQTEIFYGVRWSDCAPLASLTGQTRCRQHGGYAGVLDGGTISLSAAWPATWSGADFQGDEHGGSYPGALRRHHRVAMSHRMGRGPRWWSLMPGPVDGFARPSSGPCTAGALSKGSMCSWMGAPFNRVCCHSRCATATAPMPAEVHHAASSPLR